MSNAKVTELKDFVAEELRKLAEKLDPENKNPEAVQSSLDALNDKHSDIVSTSDTLDAGNAKSVTLPVPGQGIPGLTDASGKVIPSGEGINAHGQQVSVDNPMEIDRAAKADVTNAEAPTDQETAEKLDAASK